MAPAPGRDALICRSSNSATRSASGAGDGSGAARPSTRVAKRGKVLKYIVQKVGYVSLRKSEVDEVLRKETV